MRDDWKTIGYFAAIILLLTALSGLLGGIGPVELLLFVPLLVLFVTLFIRRAIKVSRGSSAGPPG